jgi:hypothetical protein
MAEASAPEPAAKQTAPPMESSPRRTSPRSAAYDRFAHLRGGRTVGIYLNASVKLLVEQSRIRAMETSGDGVRSPQSAARPHPHRSLGDRGRDQHRPRLQGLHRRPAFAPWRGLSSRERQSAPTFAKRALSSWPAPRARSELIESRGAPLFIGSASPLRASLSDLLSMHSSRVLEGRASPSRPPYSALCKRHQGLRRKIT